MGEKSDCLECVATCGVHQLGCEKEAMKGRKAIDCKTFKPRSKGGDKE